MQMRARGSSHGGRSALAAVLIAAALLAVAARGGDEGAPALRAETEEEAAVREANLAYLNEQRRRGGAPEVPVREEYIEGARLHCRYLAETYTVNHLSANAARLVTEEEGNPLFTREGSRSARFLDIAYGNREKRSPDDDPKLVVRFTLSTLTHRYIALASRQLGVGFAVWMTGDRWVASTRFQTGRKVIDAVKSRMDVRPVVFPGSIRDAPLRFRRETPHPLENVPSGSVFGLPVSVSFYDLKPEQIRNPEISLYLRFPEDEESAGEVSVFRSYDERKFVRSGRMTGRRKPVNVVRDYLPDTIWALPKKPLEPETWYLVAASCDIEMHSEDAARNAAALPGVRRSGGKTVRWWGAWNFRTGPAD